LIPMLAIGLSFGRLFGEAVQGWGGVAYAPGGYAVVGAAAFIAGATGAVSTAVIIFEITSQLAYMVPVLLAVLLGRAAGKVISPDLYEALQIFKNLPNIPPLAHQSSYKILAVEIMNPSFIPVVPRMCSAQQIITVLNAPSHRHDDHAQDDDLFAVVDEDSLYLGSIARHQLKALVTRQQQATGDLLDILSSANLNAVAPAVPISSTVPDLLYLFEITLCSTLFVTDHCRVVGWIDLLSLKHRIEHGEL
jgi:chloride channel 2